MFGEFMNEHPRWVPALRELDTRSHRESERENLRDDQPGAHPALFLAAMVALVVVVPLNLTGVNPALVSIDDTFSAQMRTGQWVVSAYAAALAVAVLPAGRLVDLRGPRSAATLSALVLGSGLVAAAVAPAAWWLIATRIVQGVGAAVLLIAVTKLIVSRYPPDRRGLPVGILSAALASALGAAPFIGGFMADRFGWRAIFVLLLILTVVGMAAMLALSESDRVERGSASIEAFGTGLLALAIMLLLLGLTESHSRSFLPWGASALGASVVVFGAFYVQQRRRPDPIIDFTLFKIPALDGAILARFVTGFAFFGGLYYLTILLMGVQDRSGTEAGLLLLPTSVTAVLGALVAGRIVDRVGPAVPITAGTLIVSAGMFWIALASNDTAYWIELGPALLLVGTGYGLVATPAKVAAVNAVDLDRVGHASGMTAMATNLSAAISVALISAVFNLLSAGALRRSLGKFGIRVDPEEFDRISNALHSSTPDSARVAADSAEIMTAVTDAFLSALAACAVGLAIFVGAAAFGIAPMLRRRRDA